MSKLKVSPDKKHFELDGKLFTWVGDTVWSAFTNPTCEEWIEYLDYRKNQGFHVLQINTLPQWDRILPDQGIYPYPRYEDDSLDYAGPVNQTYLERARSLCGLARERGFQLALVVNWGNLVPGTWLNHVVPTHVWPLDAVLEHVKRVVETYQEFEPIYLVSGDTDLKTEETLDYYRQTIRLLKELAPDNLRTMHLCGEYTDLSEDLARDLDFIMYQSGHGEGSEEKLASLPRELRAKFPDKPLVNGEPCYEAMPKFPRDWTRKSEGMYGEEDVLHACRVSIASGADAGITYGANGVWNWNRNEKPEDIRSLAGATYAGTLFWREAMKLPAAGKIAGLFAE